MESEGRTIFHVDVNSAFLSWSALKRLEEDPDAVDLRTIPSGVGGDVKTRHGIITAKSIPAKKYGVQTGEPVVKALQKCPQLVLVPPDFETYRKYSHALMEILSRYSPFLQQVSIDEAYLDVTERVSEKETSGVVCLQVGCKGTSGVVCTSGGERKRAIALARQIRDQVRTELGFTVNVGISCNKLLAKMASDFEKPDRTHTLYPEEVPAKSVSNERTLSEDIGRENYQADGVPVICMLSQKVAGRLQKSGLVGQTITFQIKSSDFERHSRQMSLQAMTDRAKDIEEAALLLADQLLGGPDGLFAQGVTIRLIGVGVSRLSEKEKTVHQMDLFEWAERNEEEESRRAEAEKAQKAEQAAREKARKAEQAKKARQDKLDAMMGKLNERYGKGTIRKGNSE